MRRILWLALPALVAAACSGKGNTGREGFEPTLVAQVPWINGAPPLICGQDPDQVPPEYAGNCDPNQPKQAAVPPNPMFPPIGPNTPDPGSRVKFDTAEQLAAACKAEEGIELSAWRHNFEPYGTATVGVAPFFAVYDDKTEGSWHTPEDAAFYSAFGAKRDSSIWGTAADMIQGGPSCDGAANNWALHVRGGRFNYFGGGAEHPLYLDCPTQTEACDLLVDAVGDGRPDKAMDASSYDGISFWARRGPDGAPGLMVVLQDKYTSDRLARTSQTGGPGMGYCTRYKQCIPTCADGTECKPVQFGEEPAPVYRCVPPGVDPSASLMEKALLQKLYPPCGESTCLPATYDPDVDFNNTQCKPYNFTGLDENYFCFGDTPPAAPDERCGDGFVSNVSLSTDWQFYKLPFDAFQQVGFGKKAPPNDVPQKALYSVSFLFSVGYTDFYVDNLHFYRNL